MTAYAKHRFHTLDGMRGIAAIVVMLFHYCDDLHLRCFKNPFIAVDFFFILSGFVISHAYGEKLKQGMPIADYIARRVGRLYPVLAVSVLLGAPFFYAHAVAAESNYGSRDFAVSLIDNLAMLPYFTGKHAGADPIPLFPASHPLWSISLEMLASFCFPLLLGLREKRLRIFCLGCLAVLVGSAFLRGFAGGTRLFDMDGGWSVENFLGGFPRVFFGFSCGMLLYGWRAPAPPVRLPQSALSPWLLYAALIAVLMFPSYLQGVYALLAWACWRPCWCGLAARRRLVMP